MFTLLQGCGRKRRDMRVPEEKVGKNRLHLDLRPRDQAAAGQSADLRSSARDVGWGSDAALIVMTVPDRNVCVLRATTPQ